MSATLDSVKQQLGRFYPLLIGGDEVETGQRILSRDPSNKQRIVGEVGTATRTDVEAAVAAAQHNRKHPAARQITRLCGRGFGSQS